MEFFWVYAYNLRWPILTLAVLLMAVSAFVGLRATMVRERTKFGDPDNTDAQWRQMASVQGAIAIGLLAALVFAIPSPTYNVRVIEKPAVIRTIVKKVPVIKYTATKLVREPAVYDRAYKTCIDSLDISVGGEETSQCHRQALEALRMDKGVIVKTIKVKDSYKTLFDNCNDFTIDADDARSTVSAAQIRNERLQICHKVALDGSRPN